MAARKKFRQRLVDATKRLMAIGASESEAARSLSEIGIGKREATEIVSDARVMQGNRPETQRQARARDSFWDAPVGTYFGEISATKEEGRHSRLLSFFKWLMR